MPDIVDTAITEEQDGTKALIFPAVNADYGLPKEQDNDPPIVETVEEDEDPTEPPPETPLDDFQVQDLHEPVVPDQQQPPEHAHPKVLDPGAPKPRRSQRA